MPWPEGRQELWVESGSSTGVKSPDLLDLLPPQHEPGTKKLSREEKSMLWGSGDQRFPHKSCHFFLQRKKTEKENP